MPVTEALRKAKKKYENETIDKTLIRLPKGSLDPIRVHAEKRGESLNGFIIRAISETIDKDNKTSAD